MNRFEKLQTLCKQRGLTINKLEQELGMPQSSLQKFGQSVPKADRLYKVAKYFGVPMEYFFEDGTVPIKDQADLDAYFDQINDMREKRGKPPIKEKPLFRVAAGNGCYNSQYADETVEADDGYEYATVCGDSMLPELRDGDTVKILRQAETTPHDYTLVKVDGEHATIKFVEIVENGVWLRALNKEVFEDKFFSIQEVMTLPVTIIGKVVSFERKL